MAGYGRFSLPIVTATPAANGFIYTMQLANGGNLVKIREIGLFNTGVTGFAFSMAWTANNNFTLSAPIASTAVVAGPGTAGAGGSGFLQGGSTYGTAPTLGSILRRGAIGAAIGAGIIWTWDEGEEPSLGFPSGGTQGYGITFQAGGTGTACHGYVEYTV